MKINKNLRRTVVTLALIGAGFVYGKVAIGKDKKQKDSKE